MTAAPRRTPDALPPVRFPDRAVWVDGALRRGAEATLSVFDRGARDGEGLFETIRVFGGRPFLWERHLERLVLAAAELGFPVPAAPSTLRAALDAVLAADGLVDAVARITVTRGVPGSRPTRSTAWVEAEPLGGRLWAGARRGAADLIYSARPFEPGPLSAYKTTSRLAWHLAREEARVAGADEALLVSRSGHVLEGSVSNLFAWFEDARGLVTPPADGSVLPGVIRSWAIARAGREQYRVTERPLTRAELSEASEVWVTNSVQGIVPARTLDGAAVPSTTLGASWGGALIEEASGTGG